MNKPKLQRDPAGRTCPLCIEDLGESIPLDSNGTCHGCGSCFGKSGVDEVCYGCFGTGLNDNDSDVCPTCKGSKK